MNLSIPNVGASAVQPLHTYDLPVGSGSAAIAPADAPYWFGDVQGGGHNFTWDNGIRCRRSQNAGAGARCNYPAIGMSSNIGAQAITDALLFSKRRYTFRGLMKSDNGPGSDVGCKSTNTTLASDVNNRGYSFVEVAGLWTVQRRIVAGGAPVTIATPGLGTGTWRRYEFIFTEGVSPTVVMKIDGVTIINLTGQANMPNAPASVVQDEAFGCHTNAAGNLWTYNNEILVEVVS